MFHHPPPLKLSNSKPSSVADLAFTSYHSPASVICTFLIGKKGFTYIQLSQRIGLPPLVIEECVRNDISCTSLCSQLLSWLCEGDSAIVYDVPLNLITALRQTNPNVRVEMSSIQFNEHLTTVQSEKYAAYATDIADPDAGDNTFSIFTPFATQHFRSLQNSISGSFIPILNDPDGLTTSKDWGTWLTNKLYEAFDFDGHPNNDSKDLYKSLYDQHQLQKSLSDDLLAEHISRTDYNEYVKLVSSAYHANRSEGRRTIETLSCLRGSLQQAENLPWPDIVPVDFFSINYDAQTVLRRLFGVSCDAGGDLGENFKLGEVGSESLSGQDLVSEDAFPKDFELLEQSSKEMRVWETLVKNCLLQHVRSRSESFFRESRALSLLGDRARNALGKLDKARDVGVVRINENVQQYLHIGRLYRRKKNIESLTLLLAHAQKVQRLLEEIENWITLPEREVAELSVYVHRLLDLETYFRSDIEVHADTPVSDVPDEVAKKESECNCMNGSQTSCSSLVTSKVASKFSTSMSKLVFMSAVSSRMTAARKDLQQLLCTQICLGLQSCGSETSLISGTELSRVVNAAVCLDVHLAIFETHRRSRLRAQWSKVQETVINFLMSQEGCLSNVEADRLLSLVISQDPTQEEKKSLFMYTSRCRFDFFVQLLLELIEVLVDSVTECAQCWGYFILESALDALAMHENKYDLLRRWTVHLLSTLCEDAESIVAFYLDLRCSAKNSINVAEVDRLVRIGNKFIGRLLLPLNVLSSLHSEVLGILVDQVRLGKQIAAVALTLARHSLKAQHAQQMEKLQLILEAETWASKDDIDVFFQTQVEHLCSCDDRAVREFILQSIEPVKTGYTAAEWDVVMPVTSKSTQASYLSITSSPLRKANKEHQDATFNTRANRLYLSLSQDDDGRVASNSLLILLELLINYDGFFARFPSLGLDVASRMYELLGLYDSLSANMLLGAQAIKSGVLSSISTLHLCVASQCVAFLGDFIPRLQERIVRLVISIENPTTIAKDHISVERIPQDHKELLQTSRSVRKLSTFIANQFTQVVKDCQAHRDDFLNKIISIVLEKIDRVGIMGAEVKEYSMRGNESIIIMLREVAKLIRSLRPLLPDNDLRGVVVPLLGSLAFKIRKVMKSVSSSDPDTLKMMQSDVLLFKANVERFGYDVLSSTRAQSVSAAMRANHFAPSSSDEEVLAWFLPSATN